MMLKTLAKLKILHDEKDRDLIILCLESQKYKGCFGLTDFYKEKIDKIK